MAIPFALRWCCSLFAVKQLETAGTHESIQNAETKWSDTLLLMIVKQSPNVSVAMEFGDSEPM